MTLETMRPNPTWSPAAYEDVVDSLAARRDEVVFRVWGGDWCSDCRSTLPDFGAALEAAGVPDDRIREVAVDRAKEGPGVEEYGIEYVPTIVVEHAPDDPGDGEEIVRFVESEDLPPAVFLARGIEDALGTD